MSHPVTGIDHVFLLVSDLETSAARYRRLGFTLSPRGLHSPQMGSANYTMMLRGDYIELLGMVAETEFNQSQRQLLQTSGEGLRAIACRITGAETAREALAELGIAATPVINFSRPLPLPDGSEGVASFSITQFAPQEMPVGHVFMCQHNTPEMVWRPELQTHANGATDIDAVIVATADPAAKAAEFARLFAAGTVTTAADGSAVVETGRDSAKIICMRVEAAGRAYTPEAVAATPADGFTALRLRVADLAQTARVLRENGVAFQDAAQDATKGEAGLWVAPAEASGMILHFVSA